MLDSEKDLLVTTEVTVYRRRWYILTVFSLLAMFQCCVWNTWGPVVNVVKVVFPSWSQGTISLLANWTAIAFLVLLVPVLYLQNRSLRSAILLTSSPIALGTSVRCMFLVLPDISDTDFTLLCHLGAILNGIPSIVVTSAPPAVSSAWFPPDERVTATSISQMLNNLGTGLSFLLASVIVKEPGSLNTSHNVSSQYREEMRQSINTYLLVLSVPAILLFVCSVIYFPSKPPKPPSRSSRQERLDFIQGAVSLLTNSSSWVIAIVWSVPQAIWNNWCAMMVLSLTGLGEGGETLTEQWINILGLSAILTGTVVAIMVGMATDRMKGKMKILILALLGGGGLMFSLLTLISLEVVKFTSLTSLKVTLYVSVLVGNSLVVSTSPLLMEFGVEKLYPIPEGMIGGWLNIWYNIITVVFLGLFDIPNIGTKWLNYVLPVSCFAVIPILLTVKEEYNRRTVDDLSTEQDPCDSNENIYTPDRQE